MKIPKRIRYGVRALVEIALFYPDRTVAIREVSQRLKISRKFLENIMGVLKTAGIVRAVRGTTGGYTVARTPAAVTLADVFRAFGALPEIVACVENPASCPDAGECPARDTWVELRETVTGILTRTTLETLVERRKTRTRTASPLYQI
ncbi:MAG: Rrf2 family transcriptional regulator [Planctomycetota bacterium]